MDGTHPPKLVPWVEKYRPERVEDISHQAEVVRTLRTAIEQGNLPHLLFHGPPGTGKTTTVLALARALYGPTLYRSRILELNASDERGIKVVREKIKAFAQAAVGDQKADGYPCPRFKLIILDECDSMTADAQSALRRVIENYSRVTRFCLICNYVTRIIEPLASRCAKFRFKALPEAAMLGRLQHIAAAEGVKTSPGAVEKIMEVSGGDMRRAVTFLQSCFQLSGGAALGQAVTPEIVIDISGEIPAGVVLGLWETLKGNKFDAMKRCVEDDVVAMGYPLNALLSQLHDHVVKSSGVSSLDKALICEKLAQAENCLIDGASEALQLLDVSAFIMRRLASPAAPAGAASTAKAKLPVEAIDNKSTCH